MPSFFYAAIGIKIPSGGGAIVNTMNRMINKIKIIIAKVILRFLHLLQIFLSSQNA